MVEAVSASDAAVAGALATGEVALAAGGAGRAADGGGVTADATLAGGGASARASLIGRGADASAAPAEMKPVANAAAQPGYFPQAQTPIGPVPTAKPQRPQQDSGRNRDLSPSRGGGAIDPTTGLLALAAVGGTAWMRKRLRTA